MTIEIAAVLVAVLAVGVTIAGMMPAGFRRITDQLTAAARERAHITERPYHGAHSPNRGGHRNPADDIARRPSSRHLRRRGRSVTAVTLAVACSA